MIVPEEAKRLEVHGVGAALEEEEVEALAEGEEEGLPQVPPEEHLQLLRPARPVIPWRSVRTCQVYSLPEFDY